MALSAIVGCGRCGEENAVCIQDKTIQPLRTQSPHPRPRPVECSPSDWRRIIDADLGGGVLKQRIARSGQGKSGGSRVILLYRSRERLVFVYGFEKKDRANISTQELDAFRELADLILGYSEAEMAQRIADGALIEIALREEENDGG